MRQNQFSDHEKMMLAKMEALLCHNLSNREYYPRIQIVVSASEDSQMKVLSVLPSKETDEIVRKFFFELSAYYHNEKLKLEMKLAGMDPNGTVGTYKRKL